MLKRDSDIAFAHAVVYQTALVRAWAKRTGRTNRRGAFSYRWQDLPGYITPPTNEETSRAEVILFKSDPIPYGKRYVAYLRNDDKPSMHSSAFRITTWTGETLAQVNAITFRSERHSPLTDIRGSFWATGIDGRTYYGRHNGEGIYCTLRLAKHQ